MRLKRRWIIELNRRDVEDGTVIGDISQVREAYRPILFEGPVINFFLAKTNTCLWWTAMNVQNLRETFDCAPEVKKHDKPSHGIVFLHSSSTTSTFSAFCTTFCAPKASVPTDDFDAQKVVQKAETVDVVPVLGLLLDVVQIALPTHYTGLKVVLFAHIFRTNPPSQAIVPALALDAQKASWLDKLRPANLPLTSGEIQQARLPIGIKRLGLTAPSDAGGPEFILSRFDTARSLAGQRRTAKVASKIKICEPLLADYVHANYPQPSANPLSAGAIMEKIYLRTHKL